MASLHETGLGPPGKFFPAGSRGHSQGTIVLMLKFLWPLLLMLSSGISARPVGEAFHIVMRDQVINVVSPAKYHSDLSVLIENKMSSKILGKLVRKDGAVLAYLAIAPNSSASVALHTKNGEHIFFVPEVPALQAVELIIGKEAYEIPPKKWSR